MERLLLQAKSADKSQNLHLEDLTGNQVQIRSQEPDHNAIPPGGYDPGID